MFHTVLSHKVCGKTCGHFFKNDVIIKIEWIFWRNREFKMYIPKATWTFFSKRFLFTKCHFCQWNSILTCSNAWVSELINGWVVLATGIALYHTSGFSRWKKKASTLSKFNTISNFLCLPLTVVQLPGLGGCLSFIISHNL